MEIKSYIKYVLCAICLLSTTAMSAQDFDELWITGTAVPGGAQKMERTPDGQFRYAGPLGEGQARVQSTESAQAATLWLQPDDEDAQFVNNGMGYLSTTDKDAKGLAVTFAANYYRLYVNPMEGTMRGELFHPWNELFLGGGATKNGWEKLKMQPFTQSKADPCVWTWEGELKRNDKVEEPDAFKFEGVEEWGQKELHPFSANADILHTSLLRTGGKDTKWRIRRDGRYRLTVNILKETVKAEYLGE